MLLPSPITQEITRVSGALCQQLESKAKYQNNGYSQNPYHSGNYKDFRSSVLGTAGRDHINIYYSIKPYFSLFTNIFCPHDPNTQSHLLPELMPPPLRHLYLKWPFPSRTPNQPSLLPNQDGLSRASSLNSYCSNILPSVLPTVSLIDWFQERKINLYNFHLCHLSYFPLAKQQFRKIRRSDRLSPRTIKRTAIHDKQRLFLVFRKKHPEESHLKISDLSSNEFWLTLKNKQSTKCKLQSAKKIIALKTHKDTWNNTLVEKWVFLADINCLNTKALATSFNGKLSLKCSFIA